MTLYEFSCHYLAHAIQAHTMKSILHTPKNVSESYILNCEFVLPSILSSCSHHTGGAALGLQLNATHAHFKMMFTQVVWRRLIPRHDLAPNQEKEIRVVSGV